MSGAGLATWRLRVITWGFLLASLGLILQTAYLAGNPYNVRQRYPVDPPTRSVRLPPERGRILDRHGSVLVANSNTYILAADIQAIPSKDVGRVADTLADLLGQRRAPLMNRLTRQDRKRVYLHWDTPLSVVQHLHKNPLPGVLFEIRRGREYVKGTLASNLIGYVDRSDEPTRGLERQYRTEMEGSSVAIDLKSDPKSRRRAVMDYSDVTRIHGADLILTLDEYIQYSAERILARACEENQARGGCCVVMQPGTGDVLAIASYPTFDPNEYWNYPLANFRHAAIESQYEPGSTIKPFIYGVAYEIGAVSPELSIFCENGRMVWRENRRSHSIGDSGHRYGWLTACDVVVKSSNIGAAKMGRRIGKVALRSWLERLGFGQRTELGAWGELAGVLPPVSAMYPPALETLSFGHGLAVTGIQLAQAYAMLANDGVLCPPHLVIGRKSQLVREGQPDNQVHLFPRKPARRVFKPETVAVVKEAMRGVVERGTGRRAAVPGYTVAGKTGTANLIDPERGGYSRRLVLASFAGHIPADHPAVTIVLMIDSPSAGRTYGGEVAAPYWGELAACTVRYLGIPQDAPVHETRLADSRSR